MSDLAAAYLDGCRAPVTSIDIAALSRTLEAIVDAAKASWPEVRVDAAAWIRALAGLVSEGYEASRPFGAVVASDHYLAFGCANGDRAALVACDAMLVREAAFAADGTRVGSDVRDEATQNIRTQMFVGRGDKPPAIADYAGRGALRSWFRVSVSREMVRLAKAQKRSVPLEEQLVADPGFGDDPALEELKSKYRAELADAFRTALSELVARDRTLLRYQLIDGLTIDEIGSIYKVHRATAARWLAGIRDTLVDRTRTLVASSLGVDTAEAASIVRLVQSQLDVSVIRHLVPVKRS